MLTVLRIAFRNLVKARRRTLLLGIAVSVVAIMFLVLRSVSISVGETMIEAATTLSAGHVNIGGFFKDRRRGGVPIMAVREEVLGIVRSEVPDAAQVLDRHRGWGRLIGPESSINIGLQGLNFGEEQRFLRSLKLAPQKEYRDGGEDKVLGSLDGLEAKDSAIIFTAQAKKLGADVGDLLTFVTEADSGQTNTVDLKVAAIVSDIGFLSNFSVFVPRRTILDTYHLGENTTGVVMLYLKDPDRAVETMERLAKVFRDKGFPVMDYDPQPFFLKLERVTSEDWLGQKMDLTVWKDEIAYVYWISTALDFIAFFVVAVLGIIICGGIMNAMWMSVRERIKEIGTMRAIGAKKRFVMALFLCEAMMLGFVFSLIGAGMAAVLLAALNAMQLPIGDSGVRLFLMANTLKIHIHPEQFVATVLLLTGVSGLAALFPAVRAARLKPVEALLQGK